MRGVSNQIGSLVGASIVLGSDCVLDHLLALLQLVLELFLVLINLRLVLLDLWSNHALVDCQGALGRRVE